ncbi:unnamed protein product [Heterobilharzia americana]|nr:unnamed protein product [Heterobilharzia americana]
MRRPVSDIRQREYVRHSLHENITCRRRNSSLPLHTVHALSMNQNTLDNDTDFLCDRIIEFMESGDIYSIVSVELAEQSIYFERLLHYHKGNGNIRLPEFLNPGFSSILEYIHKGVTEINNDNVYHIFIAADFFLITKLKEQCTNVLKEIINNSTIAISLWLTCHSLYWPEINKMVYEKILDNFEVIWRSKDFQYLHPYDVYQILNEDELNCKEEKIFLML